MNTHTIRNNQRGISLLELLIALVIGLLVTGGAIQLFITNKATYRVENALSRLQETGRYVVDTMAKEIRMAGYNGCSSRGNITTNVIARAPGPNPTGAANPFSSDLAIQGTDAPTGSVDVYLNASAGDALTVQRAHECAAQLTATASPNADDLAVHAPNSCDFDQTEPVVITDCESADLFQIDNTPTNTSPSAAISHNTTNSNNTTLNFSDSYNTDSQVQRYLFNSFYLAPASSGSGETSLYMSSWTPNNDTVLTSGDFTRIELAEGVEDIQILYGIDNAAPDEYADTYVNAAAVTDWADVRSVRVSLLLRSEDNITSEPRTIAFNGANAGGGDNRLRMVYTTTVTIRNRLP